MRVQLMTFDPSGGEPPRLVKGVKGPSLPLTQRSCNVPGQAAYCNPFHMCSALTNGTAKLSSQVNQVVISCQHGTHNHCLIQPTNDLLMTHWHMFFPGWQLIQCLLARLFLVAGSEATIVHMKLSYVVGLVRLLAGVIHVTYTVGWGLGLWDSIFPWWGVGLLMKIILYLFEGWLLRLYIADEVTEACKNYASLHNLSCNNNILGTWGGGGVTRAVFLKPS